MKKLQLFGYFLLALMVLSSCDKVDELNTVHVNDVAISETVDIQIIGDKAGAVVLDDPIPFSDTVHVDLNEIEQLEPYILNKISSIYIDHVNYTITNIGENSVHSISIKIVELNITTVIENIVIGEEFQLNLTSEQLSLIANHLLSTREITFEIFGTVEESPAHFKVNINSLADIEFEIIT